MIRIGDVMYIYNDYVFAEVLDICLLIISFVANWADNATTVLEK